jgi:hypothetical protein
MPDRNSGSARVLALDIAAPMKPANVEIPSHQAARPINTDRADGIADPHPA